MLPVLQIGPLAIQTYPLLVVLAGWAALAVGARAARLLQFDGDHVYNAGLYGFVGGVIAARLAHVVRFWPAYRSQPLEIFGFNTTAFLLWPGVVAAVAVAGWYIYRRRLPLRPMLDAFAPGLLVGLAIAAMGALLAGRNAGAATDLPWAIDLWGVRRHPVQAYEALGFLGVAAVSCAALRAGARLKIADGKSKMGVRPGALALTALLGWGLVVWFVEAFRTPEVAPTFGWPALLGGVRVWQVVGLGAALVAMGALRARARPLED